MKEAFRRCMRILYPTFEGIDREQHRDLIRAFSMGWVEGLLDARHPNADRTLAEYAEMTAPDWWPDATWRW